jgi:hypothetical protein
MKTALILFLLVVLSGCFSKQRYEHFQVTTPLPRNHYLVIGFLGGRERWDNPREGVRRLALELRSSNRTDLHVETVENVRRGLALELVRKALDQNMDGLLQEEEKKSVRLIVYGQSFGGAAVVKFANELRRLDIPILLTIQIDSVGRGDDRIPENVRFAANLYQRNGWFIRGEPSIRAENPATTTIVGNFEFDYSKSTIDLSHLPLWKKMFRVAHSKMNIDPEVWSKVLEIMKEVTEEQSAAAPQTNSSGGGASPRPQSAGKASVCGNLLQEFTDLFCWTTDYSAITAFDNRPLHQVGMLDHQIDPIIFFQSGLTLSQSKFLVNRFARSDQLRCVHSKLLQ